MVAESRALTRRQRNELEGYVALSTSVLRVLLFVLAVGAAAALLKTAHRLLATAVPFLSHDAWWIAPVVAFAVVILVVSGRWTGGRQFRASVRRDLAGGVAAVQRISAVDAIEVEELEDEGPAYFVLTKEGDTVLFAFQELDRYRRRGFPWTEFEIIEAPHSKVFFGMNNLGERLTPSLRRPAFTWDEFKRLGIANRHYRRLDLDFSDLKREGSME